ncbi:hypothetical protein C8J57DRAFT_1484281 [Mycena rebaudengoi]|nr:hypothetical protein C8J57DRAFT_1484281 [Mycena rebaudengoi]
MSSTYSLLVKSVDGISWKPRAFQSETPKVYVEIHQGGVVQRSPAIRGISPRWEHLSKVSSDSPISLRLLHDSAVPGGDVYMAVVDTSVAQLLDLCGSDGNTASLPLKGVQRRSKGKPAGMIYVGLIKDVKAAAMALEKARTEVGKLALGSKSSTIILEDGIIGKSASPVSNFVLALSTVTAKLEHIVRIGDALATIHPYANMAWKVLTSVYQAAKKEEDTDHKLCKLVQTMVDLYSFVGDTEFLTEKIKSLEDNVLAIVKQTLECALFIQEYTVNGFCSRAVRNTWTNPDKRIDDLSEALVRLKDSIDGSLTVQGLFLSAKVLQKLEGLVQSDTLKKLNPVDMNATSRPLCLPGTRSKILNEISEWLTVPSDSANILWLSGVAGSGKSTISTTISESFRAVDRLGAFLFFDRNDRARSHPAWRNSHHGLLAGTFQPTTLHPPSLRRLSATLLL